VWAEIFKSSVIKYITTLRSDNPLICFTLGLPLFTGALRVDDHGFSHESEDFEEVLKRVPAVCGFSGLV
jgi:hypothetical protein